MNRAQNHKIHTASLQVQFEGMEGTLGMQDNLGLLFSERIQPLLEKAFDRSAESGTTIVLDKLVLDCGRLYSENWEEEMLRAVATLLEEKLQSVRSNPAFEKTMGQQAAEVMVFFLEKGYFPWNSPFSAPIELEKSVNLSATQVSNLSALLRKSSIFRARFHRSFSNDFQLGLLDQLVKNPPLQIKEFLDFVSENASRHPQFFQEVFQIFLHAPNASNSNWGRVFMQIIESLSASQLPIFAEFFAALWIGKRESIGELLIVVKQETQPGTLEKVRLLIEKAKAIQPELADDLDRASDFLGSQKPNPNPSTSSTSHSDSAAGQLADKELPASREPVLEDFPSRQEEAFLMESVEEIFVSNAGLVLLHPFIPALLDTLGLQKDGHFISPEAQMSAANVLQFLVWGENSLSENHFPLIKILLGMPVHQVLNLEIEMPETCEIECDAMLSEVIRHWSVLKNTSIAGLRETFLQREGKISPSANGWKLQVERKTVDVLLDKLPWGIGIIKLPWMNELMYVDWN
jgi:hypothetical protein